MNKIKTTIFFVLLLCLVCFSQTDSTSSKKIDIIAISDTQTVLVVSFVLTNGAQIEPIYSKFFAYNKQEKSYIVLYPNLLPGVFNIKESLVAGYFYNEIPIQMLQDSTKTKSNI